MIKISVIIPTYNRCRSVNRLLAALAKQTFPKDNYEVIVSIDGSDDGTIEMINNFDSPYLLRSKWILNSGRASARNHGIALAEGDILIFLDDDMIPTPNLISAHYEHQLMESKLGIIGSAPIKLNTNSTPIARYIASEFNSRQKKMSSDLYQFRIWDFYIGNFSIRRNLLESIGTFNESFIKYGYEDIELAQRLIDVGVKIIYEPKAKCEQFYNENFRDLAKKTIDAGKTAVLLVTLHPSTFEELKFREYNLTGWKWRYFRLSVIRLCLMVPIVINTIIFMIELLEKKNSKILDKLYFLALDIFFWLGVWSAIKNETKNNFLISKIKSYRMEQSEIDTTEVSKSIPPPID